MDVEYGNVDFQDGVYGDPCIVASPKKDFYYLHLSNPDGQAWSSEALLDRIVIQRSKKAGKRWNKGVEWV